MSFHDLTERMQGWRTSDCWRQRQEMLSHPVMKRERVGSKNLLSLISHNHGMTSIIFVNLGEWVQCSTSAQKQAIKCHSR